MDKNMKQARAARARQEEAVLNRILLWIAGGAVMEFLLLLLNRYYCNVRGGEIDIFLALANMVKVLAFAALACAAAALFWRSAAGKNRKSTTLPTVCALFLFTVSVSCFAAWFLGETGVRLMYLSVPVVVVLVVVFYLYQHEFFLIACMAVLALLGVWAKGMAQGGHAFLVYLYTAVAAAAVLAAVWLCRKAQGSGGTVTLRGQEVRLFAKNANYAALYAGALVSVALLIAAAVGINAMVLYGVAAAWLLIMAVYYTVKLM